jgi:hypothetical protein
MVRFLNAPCVAVIREGKKFNASRRPKLDAPRFREAQNGF